MAIEERTFPLSLSTALNGIVDGFVDIRGPLDRMRSTKTTLEVALLRRNAEIAAIGQQAAVDVSAAGRTELEIFADVRCAMESAAGERIPVTGDLISGPGAHRGLRGMARDTQGRARRSDHLRSRAPDLGVLGRLQQHPRRRRAE